MTDDRGPCAARLPLSSSPSEDRRSAYEGGRDALGAVLCLPQASPFGLLAFKSFADPVGRSARRGVRIDRTVMGATAAGDCGAKPLDAACPAGRTCGAPERNRRRRSPAFYGRPSPCSAGTGYDIGWGMSAPLSRSAAHQPFAFDVAFGRTRREVSAARNRAPALLAVSMVSPTARTATDPGTAKVRVEPQPAYWGR
ncbi:hypothetical protein GCM10009540_70360 [Streptomyces turgidiscabies]